MARLAAYYQEDFHYAPVGYGTKQRKAAYLVYKEPKNNLFHNGYSNGGPRIRALATSEPTLSPTYTYSPKTAVMTLKARAHPFDNKLVEQSRMAVQRLQSMYEPTQCINPYALAQLEADAFDCESVYSHSGRGGFDNPYVRTKSKPKDKVCKRLSYDSPHSSLQSPEMCLVRGPDRYHPTHSMQVRSVDTVNGESFPHECNFMDPCEDCLMPPMSYRSDSSHGRWQQWPWNMVDTPASPAMLSSPSPLDSGLSSQSITSSPSLDAEPLPIHPGQTKVIRCDGDHACSCARVYTEPRHIISSPGKYDSGRSSPGAYSVTPRSKKSLVRMNNSKNINNGMVYVENDFDDDYSRGQVRYGMLGLIGEPVQQSPIIPKVPNGNYHNSEYIPSNNVVPSTYYYIEENGVAIKRCGPRSSKSKKPQPNYTRPTVVITEASDKSNSPTSNNSPSSPDQDNSDKSPEPESSMSIEASNPSSQTSSVASSNNDAENEERRKASRKTEKEIRELEDMYKKCNLGDYDLLERAERRDLPTAHQTRQDQNVPTLTRSKSDTFYEMLGPMYTNPYEHPRRAPPLRRSGIPDIIGDDMALRKNNKPVTTSSFNPADSTITYMLCSSHFTPTVSAGRDILLMDNPDVEYDDFSYRKHYLGKKGKIMDPQPPFGIPLRPPPPQNVYNDYLHIVPMGGPPPLCHPRRNPDVVRDDMAFRTLRKDEPERLYYDAADVYRKKRG